MILNREDLFMMARAVYGEARGEPHEGKKAVAHAILNRVVKGSPDETATEAAVRNKQFSAFNKGDPNFLPSLTVDVTDKVFRRCLAAALDAIDEPDFTKGARHYHTIQAPKSAALWPPVWAQGHQPCFRTESHVFYNDIA